MKDEVIATFNKLRVKSPGLGKIPCLACAVRGKNLTEKQIKRYLKSLCTQDYDYFKKELKYIVKWLWRVSIGKTESR